MIGLLNRTRNVKNGFLEYTAQLAKAQSVTEEPKARDRMAWAGAMNTIKAQTEEIVIQEILRR